MPVNWFDVAAVLILVAGLFRGRKNGMSGEILPLCEWLSVIIVGALFYPAVGRLLVKAGGLNLLMAYVSGYIVLTLVVFFIFSRLKRALTPRLSGSSLFGNAEYYLGMPSGLVRFGCMLLFALAFLNARHFTAEEIQAGDNYQKQWYGAHYFPNLYDVQKQVFEDSFTGHCIRKYLGGLLIESTPLHGNQPEQGPPPAH